MNVSYARIVAIALIMIAVGCSSDDHTASISDANVVMNTGSGAWDAQDIPGVQFELTHVFGAEDKPVEALLAGVSAVEVDSAGNLYVLDPPNSRLMAFDAEGNVLWTVGRPGEGPGEFTNAWSMAYDGGDRLVVLNQRGGRIDIWSTSGTYQHSISTQPLGTTYLRLLGFAAPDTLVFHSPYLEGIGSEIHIAALSDDHLTLVHQYFIPQGDQTERPPLPVHANVLFSEAEGKVYSGHVENYQLDVFSLSGALTASIRREENHLLGPAFSGTGRDAEVAVFSGLMPIARFASGHLVARTWWPSDIGSREAQLKHSQLGASYQSCLDFFDADGVFLGSVACSDNPASELGFPIAVDGQNRLYTTVSLPYPQIRRYDVTFGQAAPVVATAH
ncbi:MAG: 6-bladed beta-propeller [Bacteroidota bacterium]